MDRARTIKRAPSIFHLAFILTMRIARSYILWIRAKCKVQCELDSDGDTNRAMKGREADRNIEQARTGVGTILRDGKKKKHKSTSHRNMDEDSICATTEDSML